MGDMQKKDWLWSLEKEKNREERIIKTKSSFTFPQKSSNQNCNASVLTSCNYAKTLVYQRNADSGTTSVSALETPHNF